MLEQVAPGWRLRVLAYRDAARARHRDDPEALAAYDVVLCTYGCLLWDSALKGTPRGLFRSRPWLRAGHWMGFVHGSGQPAQGAVRPVRFCSLAAQGCARVWSAHPRMSCMVQVTLRSVITAGWDTKRGFRVPETLHGCAGLQRVTAEHLCTGQNYIHVSHPPTCARLSASCGAAVCRGGASSWTRRSRSARTTRWARRRARCCRSGRLAPMEIDLCPYPIFAVW